MQCFAQIATVTYQGKNESRVLVFPFFRAPLCITVRLCGVAPGFVKHYHTNHPAPKLLDSTSRHDVIAIVVGSTYALVNDYLSGNYFIVGHQLEIVNTNGIFLKVKLFFIDSLKLL